MVVETPVLPDEGNRMLCRNEIERFLDRSWYAERISRPALRDHRFALTLLDTWLQKNRRATLISASAMDLRELLNSRQWQAVSLQCEGLLTLVTRLFQDLRNSKCRPDDPMETLVDQELSATVRRKETVRPARAEPLGRTMALV